MILGEGASWPAAWVPHSTDVPNRRNYYRILHVQPDAPTEIIRMSYLTLMQRLKRHPDLGGDHAQAALINEAFASLVDPEQRAAYDRALARDRALPGYRSGVAHTETAVRMPRGARDSKPFSCPFCGSSFARHDLRRVDAVCTTCESPLYPAARHDGVAASRRAINRIPRRLPITWFLVWPQPAGFVGTTEDISTQGLRFTGTVDLVPSERIKIDCDFCSAVAVVRHSRVWSGSPDHFEIGVEFLTLLIKPARGRLVSASA